MAKIQLTKEQIDLLKMGSVINMNKPEPRQYYYLPYWFEHDDKTDTWTIYLSDKLPEAVKKTINELKKKKK